MKWVDNEEGEKMRDGEQCWDSAMMYDTDARCVEMEIAAYKQEEKS